MVILTMPTLLPTVEVTPTSDTLNVSSFIGLGPNSGSRIHSSLNSPSGDTVLDRIFQQNVSTPNILTILLERSNDPAEMYPGDITVGEIFPGMENITNEPHVSVTALPPVDSADQHWQVLIDENGIIGPDGNPIQVQTGVQSTANPNQLTVVFDTGSSFAHVPQCVLCIFFLTQRHSYRRQELYRTRYILASLVHPYRPWMVWAQYGLYHAMPRSI
jgi:hypothetical protein